MNARDAIVNGNFSAADQSLTDGATGEWNRTLPEINEVLEITDQDYHLDSSPPKKVLDSWR